MKNAYPSLLSCYGASAGVAPQRARRKGVIRKHVELAMSMFLLALPLFSATPVPAQSQTRSGQIGAKAPRPSDPAEKLLSEQEHKGLEKNASAQAAGKVADRNSGAVKKATDAEHRASRSSERVKGMKAAQKGGPQPEPPGPKGGLLSEPARAKGGHPYYFPVADGGRWTYQETRSVQALGGLGDGETQPASQGTTTVIRQPISEASFREQTRLRGEGSESSSSGEWSCQDEGLRTSGALDLVAMLVSLDDLGPWVDTGVDVPRAAAWRVGAKWRHVAEANSSQGSEAAAKHITVSNSCEIVSSEQVTVPARTYEAFRVECTATVDAEGSERNGRLLTTATTAWHAQGVGIVKSRTLSTLGGSGSGAGEGIRMERTIALKAFTGMAPR